MSACPAIVCCWEGVDAIHVVRQLAGSTNGRNAQPGTIRGDSSINDEFWNVKEPECIGNPYTSGSDILEPFALFLSNRTKQPNY